jgi:hypothetical protein
MGTHPSKVQGQKKKRNTKQNWGCKLLVEMMKQIHDGSSRYMQESSCCRMGWMDGWMDEHANPLKTLDGSH